MGIRPDYHVQLSCMVNFLPEYVFAKSVEVGRLRYDPVSSLVLGSKRFEPTFLGTTQVHPKKKNDFSGFSNANKNSNTCHLKSIQFETIQDPEKYFHFTMEHLTLCVMIYVAF